MTLGEKLERLCAPPPPAQARLNDNPYKISYTEGHRCESCRFNNPEWAKTDEPETAWKGWGRGKGNAHKEKQARGFGPCKANRRITPEEMAHVTNCSIWIEKR